MYEESSFCLPDGISVEQLTGHVDSRFFILGDKCTMRLWNGGSLHSQRKSFAGFSLEIVSLETDKSMNLYTDMKKQNAFLFAASDGKIRVTLASEKASKDFDKDILTLCVSPGNCLLSFEKGISIFYHVILNRAYVNGLPAIYLGYII